MELLEDKLREKQKEQWEGKCGAMEKQVILQQEEGRVQIQYGEAEYVG